MSNEKKYVGTVKAYTNGIRGGGYINKEVTVWAKDKDEAKRMMESGGDRTVIHGPYLVNS